MGVDWLSVRDLDADDNVVVYRSGMILYRGSYEFCPPLPMASDVWALSGVEEYDYLVIVR